MGVRGLMTYIYHDAKSCLKTFELHDCFLLIDGSNVLYYLACSLKSHSVFGGDYDEYYALVRSFMLALKKCNIYPIVLFDGGCDDVKIKVKLKHRNIAAQKLLSFSQGPSEERIFPLFLIQVFINVVKDMKFTCIQCDFKATGEIAAVAKQLNIPVLSYNSDFFIYDVTFIPLDKLKQSPVKYSNSSKYYIDCSVYNVGEFLKAVGLDRSSLLLLATLLNNECEETAIFQNFLNHVRRAKNKKQFPSSTICLLVQWLKNENFNSALNKVLMKVEERDANIVLKFINKIKKKYSTFIVSEAVSNELTTKFGEINLAKKHLNINWPSEISQLISQNVIPGFLINMALDQIYLTPVQVENINEQSSHLKSLNFIRKIYTMLTPYLKAKESLQLYLVSKEQYTCIKLDPDPSDYINLEEVLKHPLEERLKLLCDTVGVPMDNLKFVPFNSWAVFMLSFIYWVKEFKNSLSLAHIHAFVIMMIANQIVQSKVGYYRNTLEFIEHYGDELSKLRDTELILEETSNFEEMLTKVKQYECLIVQKELIPLRRTTEEGSGKEYCLPTIHLFNCFQSCLYYIMVINGLLNFPLPHLKVENFYSGTLLFNLFINIKSKPSVEEFGSTLFLQTPNLNQIYKYLSVKLAEISEVTQAKSRP